MAPRIDLEDVVDSEIKCVGVVYRGKMEVFVTDIINYTSHF